VASWGQLLCFSKLPTGQMRYFYLLLFAVEAGFSFFLGIAS
jgi:hypothetical protein